MPFREARKFAKQPFVARSFRPNALKGLALASALHQGTVIGEVLVRLHSPNIFATKAAKVSDDLNIVTGSLGKDQSVAIHGRITVANSGQMRAALANLLRTKPACIAVDLSGVSYIDSSGVATLIEAARIARGQATRLSVCGMHDQPRYFFEIAHLDQFFDSTGQEPSK